jgi:MtN3 and saliva related transmembrane protein
MDLFVLLQLIGGIILLLGNIPQIIQIIKTKSVGDLNLTSFSSILLGILFMEIYAVNLVYTTGNGIAFLITNTFSLLTSGLIVTLIIIYKKDHRK